MQTKDFYKQNSERAGNKAVDWKKNRRAGKKTVDWKQKRRAGTKTSSRIMGLSYSAPQGIFQKTHLTDCANHDYLLHLKTTFLQNEKT